jgi:hypothetical protein
VTAAEMDDLRIQKAVRPDAAAGPSLAFGDKLLPE